MGFSKKIKESVLVASARHCCVCHRYKGVKIEVHHILPKEQGGKDTIENAIPLCFDCHSDAGHYHAKHPKGTKFSIEELKQHKATWYEIVKSNNISHKEETHIHSRYIITKEFDLIKEISNRDFSRFPIKNCLLLENNSSREFKSFFSNQTDRRLEIEKLISLKPDNYMNHFPESTKITQREEENNTFFHQRIPSIDEISDVCKEDHLSMYLVKHNVPAEKIVKLLTCYESPCGGGSSFEELYHIRPLYFKFLALTNISDKYMKPKSLITLQNEGILYNIEEIKNNICISFPEILIEPNQTIVIPLGMFLACYADLEKSENYIRLNEIHGERSIVFDHVNQNENQSIEYFGINHLPRVFKYEKSNKNFTHSIHEFDFNNFYWIDGFWNCGSCPHLFYLNNQNNLIYKGELFNNLPEIESSNIFIIEKNIKQIVIAELEHEKTTIKSVKLNGDMIISNIQLTYGQDLRIEVNESDELEIVGFYSISFKSNMKLPVLEKYSLIEKYKNNSAQYAVGHNI